MPSILPILLDTVLMASKTDAATRRVALADLDSLVGPHVPDVELLLLLIQDSMRHVNMDMHDLKGDQKPQFRTSELMDELLFRFCGSWASEAVKNSLATVVELRKKLDDRLSALVPLADLIKPGRASALPTLNQAERLYSAINGFCGFESGLKSSTYKTRGLFFPFKETLSHLAKPGTVLGDLSIKAEEARTQVASLPSSMLIERLIDNITKSDLLRDLDRPVYGTNSLYFYLPAIADRVINPSGPAMSLEYCQMCEQKIQKTLRSLAVVEATLQEPGDGSPAP
ncbi:hypothetical protein DV532_29930 (plasmid) [Pseudomonas sp. Leaf58]|uniref:hypothetical protein n=1 Tax=Pseudomonas sp. Leaf58 TaxID=1736226 RepID=UPI0006F4CD33|nr:hypothetical protein [Pseudomonas sp. Leaf58]AYG48450.1 hypothetical protein DV532_29930 [Pseudomonas sp. Leaf58]KQN62004.1 hypothetical protein ASF02_07390 [Pseudomonas sp. Leaf58]